MGDERYPRSNNPQGDYYGRRESGDYGRDYGSGRDYSYSSARSYQASGQLGGGNDRDDRHRDWGSRDYGNERYGQRERGYGRSDHGQAGYGQTGQGQGQRDRGNEYHGSYGHDGRRFEDVGRYRDQDDDNRPGGNYGNRSYGRQPQGYDYEDRGFLARAGDEVRSWFGDDEAERRREYDERLDQQRGGQRGDQHPDADYHHWRRGQVEQFDRDYAEYRDENRNRFKTEFATWRTARQGQRDSLSQVQEHMDVVGSDGAHVGTVDKIRGDRIILTKSDTDAGGRHHSIPSRWIQTIDTKVTLSKTAQEAKDHWRDEERQTSFEDQNRSDTDRSGTNLNRSFSGTY